MAIPAMHGQGADETTFDPNRFENFADMDYAEIGNRIRIPPRIDPNDWVTEYIRASMNIVELIPMEFKLNAMKVLKSDEWIVEYIYKGEKYIQACNKYGLKACKGVRLWLTKESTFQEDFTNTYEQNTIEQTINKVASTGKFINQIKQIKTGAQSYDSDYMLQVQKTTKKLIEEHTESKTAAGLWQTASDIAFMGKQLSLPKIWATSDYQPSLSLAVNLSTPYGSPNAIKKFIIQPLVYLLILASPRSLNGVSYGYPFTLRVKAHGIASINMGFIQSLSIRRGGSNIAYNQYRQPLSVDVNISIMPLTSGFASIEKDGPDDSNIDVTTDSSDFLSVESGASVATIGSFIDSFKPYRWEKDKQINLEGSPIDRNNDLSKSESNPTVPKSNPNNNRRNNTKGSPKYNKSNTYNSASNNYTPPKDMFISKNTLGQNLIFSTNGDLIDTGSKFLLNSQNNNNNINSSEGRMQVTENIIDHVMDSLI